LEKIGLMMGILLNVLSKIFMKLFRKSTTVQVGDIQVGKKERGAG